MVKEPETKKKRSPLPSSSNLLHPSSCTMILSAHMTLFSIDLSSCFVLLFFMMQAHFGKRKEKTRRKQSTYKVNRGRFASGSRVDRGRKSLKNQRASFPRCFFCSFHAFFKINRNHFQERAEREMERRRSKTDESGRNQEGRGERETGRRHASKKKSNKRKRKEGEETGKNLLRILEKKVPVLQFA